MLRWILITAVVLLVSLAAYVRLAPFDASAHASSYPADLGNREGANSFQATRLITTSNEDILKAVDQVILRTERTKLMAGGVTKGMMTYETRSKLWGFPDYTTVWIDSDISGSPVRLNIRGKARFGASDLGVNKVRIEQWLNQLGPLIVAP